MKKWQKILIIAVVVILALGFIKNVLIKSAVTTFGAKIIGAPIEIGHFSLSLITQKIHIKKFKLYNPPGFPGEPMVDFPEIRVDYDVFALLGGKLHCRLVIVNMKQMTVIINNDGKLNVDSLKIVEEQKARAETAKKAKTEPQAPQKEMAFQIDKLKLNMEKVIVKDYSKSDPPAIKVYDIGLKDKTFENIDSVNQMILLVLIQGMGPTALKSAGIYVATAFLGVGFFPAAVFGVIVAEDASAQEFNKPFAKCYQVSLDFSKKHGQIKSEDKNAGIIKAKIDGADITIKIEKKDNRKTGITVAVRKYMLARPEVAGGILYQIAGELK